LLVICLVNVSVAMTIGLVIMNTWQPGLAWTGHVDQLLQLVPGSKPSAKLATSQTPIEDLAAYIPRTILAPFSSNNIIGVVLLALVIGALLRRLHVRTARHGGADHIVVRGVERIYEWLVRILGWIIHAVPFAVFGVVAQVVGKSGVGVFSVLWIFLVAMLAGLAIHALIYYPLVAWLVGKKSPKVYLGQGADAIMTAMSCNSSLATVPVTLQCLDRMKVSAQSSRLAACVGTNLNNDGITLYEAMAALFLAQALGYDLSLTSQFLIVAASIIAGAGVAGIPEAGLIVLPLVLSAAGLPDNVIVAAIPLIMTVDWIIARARSGVNVMSDMLVAILLDAGLTTAAQEPQLVRYRSEAAPSSESQPS
jgi:Na+/H+-dicarboxylate symporter